MKKVLCLSLVLLMTIGIMGNVYAAISCSISAQTSKDAFSKNEEFTVDFVVSNIQSERGIIAIGATLSYDKDSLTLVKMEGQNGWETPSYNEQNGEMAFTRNMLSKNSETFLKITFKVKEGSKQNPTITLSNITVGDGKAPDTVNSVTKNITVTNGTPDVTPSTKPTTTPSTAPSTIPSVKPTSNTDNNIPNGKLPQTGINNTALQVCIALFAVSAVVLYIKIKVINKKANK